MLREALWAGESRGGWPWEECGGIPACDVVVLRFKPNPSPAFRYDSKAKRGNALGIGSS